MYASGGGEEGQVSQQLSEPEGRLIERYARHSDFNEGRVCQTFGQVSQRFAVASIRSFVPILAERAVRRELEV